MQQGDFPEELVGEVYEELRVIAELYLRRQPPEFTLRPTEIVHEACMHFLERQQGGFADTTHFRAIAARKMWQIIVDHVRRRQALKRGGAARAKPVDGATAPPAKAPARKRLELDHVTLEWRDQIVDLLDLDDALADLRRESRRLHDVMILHWFGEMTFADVAVSLNLSTRTVQKDYHYALAWLNRRLERTTQSGH